MVTSGKGTNRRAAAALPRWIAFICRETDAMRPA
jgi:hypothetical protein